MRSNIVFEAKHQTPCLLQLVTKQSDFDFIHFSLDMTHMQKYIKAPLALVHDEIGGITWGNSTIVD
ncbi:hypothetical protein HanXRQr2_Chr03g0106591 [Helianthus annuus]|uniref:Uncharacterized protein n=1 Tax=Helianthus annuus TaxID=4232 RepID=A0A9K3JFK6_HELAN|nr:hypothetical protein HanXRQr2_Chr03g0106591 [Helianthus annuus]KAJ0943346.1 hypothetical protein HanPSC8_Chr03g0103141 [Helianthus annuus]